MSRLPYLRRDELDHAGQEVWDSIVGSREALAGVSLSRRPLAPARIVVDVLVEVEGRLFLTPAA